MANNFAQALSRAGSYSPSKMSRKKRYIFNLDPAYFQAGRYRQAISALEEALTINLNFPAVHYQLVRTFFWLDK
jgi:tetratricopeptide (TPR) repeat protein